jgi:hypothetical protein
MNNGKLRIVGCVAGLAGLLLCSSAFAQDAAPAAPAPAPPPEPAPAPAPPASTEGSASTSGSAQVGMALPGSEPQAAAVAGTSDHDSVVGRLAFGYLGRNGLTIATGAMGNGSTATTIDTPVIGIRYWLTDMVGIDAGVGFGIASSSQEIGGVSTDNPSLKVFMLHGGVPLSLASAGHFSFQIVPEMNVGFAGQSVEAAGVETKFSGFHFDIGARAGAEIHFGFINIPQLSLQGSVGVRANIDSTGFEQGMVDNSSSSFTWSTTVGDNPWNIFTSNVAALYYF